MSTSLDTTTADPVRGGAAHRGQRSRRRRSGRLLRARLLLAAPITAVVSMATFWLASLSPFDPLAAYLGSRFEKTSSAQRAILAEQLGLDDSWIAIWGRWIRDVVLHWDWGQSRSLARPVSDVLADRLPYTLLLAGSGLTIAIVLSLLLGVRAAWKPGSWTDRCATALAYSMQGIPPFVVALVAISVFSSVLGMPAGGVSAGGADPTAGSIARHLVLPAFVLGLSQVPWLLLNVRSSVISALGEDHVTAAREQGPA
ncbi:ABC transporter permease [Aeromicrobium sp. UC242_57]|uniref:ABC transporter permease n=1 Tax=Aeromicrobium sp. UC242_57 TaxID=3374624 RepID=UPI0037A41A02